jgi:hypothetical protein
LNLRRAVDHHTVMEAVGKDAEVRQTVTSERDILTFGKFRGKSVKQVLLDEPGYILWLHEEEIVAFPEDIVIEAERLDDERDRYEEYRGEVEQW